jgi:hypothetical protein
MRTLVGVVKKNCHQDGVQEWRIATGSIKERILAGPLNKGPARGEPREDVHPDRKSVV